MKPEEAIKMLKYNSNVIHKTINGETDINEVEALDMAISALEKQIPKKAVRDERFRYGMRYEYYDWACPTCGRLLAFECDINRSNIHHCRCGQAIDWEEE